MSGVVVEEHDNRVPNTGQWFMYILVSFIPIVSIFFLIAWALDGSNLARRGYARAFLLMIGVWSIIYVWYHVMIYMSI